MSLSKKSNGILPMIIALIIIIIVLGSFKNLPQNTSSSEALRLNYSLHP